jgi:outer membrane protein
MTDDDPLRLRSFAVMRRTPLWLAIAAASVLAGCASRTAPIAATEPLPPQLADGGSYSGRQLDSVEPATVPRLTDNPTLPSATPADPAKMPPYDGTDPPAGDAPLSLQQVYDLALTNDPTLRAAYSELQAVGQGAVAARAGLLPTVTAEGSYTSVQEDVVQTSNTVYQKGSATWPETAYTLSLTQPLFDMSLWQKWRQAQAAERKEVASYAFAQQDLILRVATAYLSILAAQDQITLSAAERDTTRKQLEQVKARFQNGQVTSVDLSEIQARLDVQDANYLLAQSSLADRQQALLEIIGRADVRLQPIRDDLKLVGPEPSDVQSWLKQSLDQNWSIRVAAAAAEVARKEVAVQRAGHYPTVSFKASTGTNETGDSLFGGGSTVDDTRYMVSLRIPLYQGGYASAMTRAAASRLTAAEMQLSLARRKVQRQVLAAYRGITVGMDRVSALRRSVQSFQQTLDLKQQGYQSGLNDIVSVLDAARHLYDAKRQEAEARYNYLLDTLKLKQAAGILSEQDIIAISHSLA